MKKGGLLAIELSPGGREGSGEVEMGKDDGEEGGDMAQAKLDAAKAVMAAIKAGDAQALSDALEEHRACCDAEGEE